MISHEDYLALCQEIWKHSRLYYIEHTPEISDQEFDLLYTRLEEIEAKHPEWIEFSSPSQRVGEALTEGFKSVKHTTPMLSLANSYSKEEVEDFIRRIQKLGGKIHNTFSCELKMDGIAISARYENGLFVRGVTRGDGKQGDDITANMRTIQALPLQLYGKDIPPVLEIRGEVFMPHQEFSRLNQEKEEAGDEAWANPRNAAAGSLKLLNPEEVAKRRLSIVFYGIADAPLDILTKQSASHDLMKEWGLPILALHAACESIDEIWNFVEKVREKRKSLPFDIDGVVIKLDDIKEQQKLGVTGKNPRWAVAYKFAAEQAKTRIHHITVQVGRTGVLTPVAELTPVFLAGSTIARATLHNEEEVQRKDIRVNDLVTIEKGGDVIPKVVEVDFLQRPENSQPWIMPTTCPSCGAEVERVPGEVAVRCPNLSDCPAQVLRRILHFAGKSAMDIDNLGIKVAEQLVNRGFISQPSDIYTLNATQLATLDGFKEKSIDNLLKSIEHSKNVTLDRFIMGLGIKYVGIGTAELLAKKAGSVDSLRTFTYDALMQIDGIGSKVASALVDFFANPSHQQELQRLLELGIIPKNVEVKSFGAHAFNGKTFVLTGSLSNYTRSSAASLIKERGGVVTNAVSKKTDFLLAGEAAGSKLDKAQALGVSVLSEADFDQML